LGVPSVVTIHDVLHVTRPENPYQKVIGKRLITSACRRASKIITVSQRSYQELLKVSEGISGDAIVIPNALSRDVVVPTAEQLIETRNKLNTDSRYFLFVGSDRPHKGLKLLLDSYKLAKEVALTESMPKVVLVGERYGRWVNEYLSQLGIEADVQLLGAVSTERLNCLYLGAEAVLLPSLDEGFGLVALEAMSLGAPVICFPLEVLREISNSFWFAENCNAESFSQMILKVMSSPDLVKARALLAREDTSKFSIKNVASKTLHVYLSCQVDSEGRKRNEIDDTIDAHLTDTVH
jgi:alpha-1,3-rhamnosyl/mannosyltransferase